MGIAMPGDDAVPTLAGQHARRIVSRAERQIPSARSLENHHVVAITVEQDEPPNRFCICPGPRLGVVLSLQSPMPRVGDQRLRDVSLDVNPRRAGEAYHCDSDRDNDCRGADGDAWGHIALARTVAREITSPSVLGSRSAGS